MENIIFTRNINCILGQVLENFASENIFILADTGSNKYCVPLLNLERINVKNRIVIGEGEVNKSPESVLYIWKILSDRGAKRNAVLVNVGGGLVTDIGGFAAACFKRGIKCINVPTTLLSQVDASVGGKTGMNFNGLKNEIGTFSLPEKVIIDISFLKTLPQRQILSGFAEMLKHALLAGGEHFEAVFSVSPEQIDWENFAGLLEESVKVKYAVVKADPQEAGIRKALNFGHTVGHAIESAAIEKGMELYHGDAVAYGMLAELYLSEVKMGFESGLYERIRQHIRRIYPSYIPQLPEECLYGLMLHDKKNEQEGVNFTLLRRPGEFSIDNYCSQEEILEALRTLSNP
ncbi:3-dehydroquinate synthase [uncultured Odoribacter sp.]|uniref:3-dehydroquinate synthase n=1 Tax=uncultured Odoribacter sp. TaxID=876416 RepID=UPI002620F792|nr:3-dehydroquinate synthase [uncultured Odoribacter sp.]